jgi:acyl-CoA thioesterase FadM
MMRWLRLLWALFSARYRSKLNVNNPSVLSFRVWLTDVDASIMNHASMMTVMEAGRIDLMVRAGFFRLARKEKWYFPTSAINVQFLRPLKIFQKATLTTRVVHVTQTAIYVEQKITLDEKHIAYCLVKATVKKGRETLDIPAIVRQLGGTNLPAEIPALIEAFEKNNDQLKERLSSVPCTSK